MKINKFHFVVIIIALLIGTILGILFQKFYGFGNILVALGMDYHTELISVDTEAKSTPQETENIPEEYQGKMQLFILAGQSNMSGRGNILQSQNTNPRIYVFGNDYHWRLAVEPIDDPLNQVDKVSEDSAGFSLASSFSSTILQQQPDLVIGLIPCAKGGSSIYEWRRSLSDSTLYGSCLKRVSAASLMGNVAGILFFQGETETLDPENTEQIILPNQWAEDFTDFVNNWRSDLGQPELPVVFAQIGTNANPDYYPNWEIVQTQQSLVQLPFCKMVITKDLTLKDQVHFTTESYQIIGRRFAEAYLSLLQGK